MILPTDDRPSKLELDRYATGELDAAAARTIEARLDDRSRQHLDAVSRTRDLVPPLDLATLRARAHRPETRVGPAPPRRAPANVVRWMGPLVAVMAACLALWIGLPTTDEGTITLRSGDALLVHHAVGDALVPYDGSLMGEGDVLGFKVNAEQHETVVVVSVDGTGTTSVFFPARGDTPVPLDGRGVVPLTGTVVLDGAPGPEVFVALFDVPVSAARDVVRRTFSAGGHEGLVDWAREAPGVDAVTIERR